MMDESLQTNQYESQLYDELEASRARITSLEAKLAALLADADAAMDYSGNRWSEWGTRAEIVGEMLDAAILKARDG
jgi:hypothetical protein